MENYNEVPDIITGKDLDYLSDIFNWHYGAYKKSISAQKKLQNEELIPLFEKASNTFYNNMTTVLNILNQGGNHEQ